MTDVTLGTGALAGRGLYAGRDFAAGEDVVAFELQPIDEAEFVALSVGDRLFVHSYGGRRYLYPAPARFVNHSDRPTCYEDFDRWCDIALRPIAEGEPITIDATRETAHELATFLDAYRDSCRSRSQESLSALIDEEAVRWAAGDVVRGRAAVVTAVLAEDELGQPGEAEWLVGTGRWEAVCSAGMLGDPTRHLTMLVKVVLGNWQLIYQHVG